jgi:hypothetical protein
VTSRACDLEVLGAISMLTGLSAKAAVPVSHARIRSPAVSLWPRTLNPGMPSVRIMPQPGVVLDHLSGSQALLIAGLLSRTLPSGFADPTAFGDPIGLALAYIAFIGLQSSREGPLLRVIQAIL